MITIKQFIFNPIQVNSYVLSDETKKAVIIDAGFFNSIEEKALFDYIEQNQLEVEKLLITHGHFDHVLGNKRLHEKLGIELWAHKADEKLIQKMVSYAALFGYKVEPGLLPHHYLSADEEISFGNSHLQVIHVPGHSAGSVAFYSTEGGFAIVGDVLFKGSIGRTDLEDGDLDVLLSSIYNKLYTLPNETVIFSGHGSSTSIGIEKKTNPFT
jgi:glyoxylase-like metal-dependent hydrolase (beta-lactamase superfamily II)